MKKFYIALVGLLFVCIGAVGQTTFTYQGIKYGINSKGEAYVAKNPNVSGNITIPRTVYNGDKSYDVMEIGNEAFECNQNLKSITIGGYVRKIGNGAFFECKALTTVKMGDYMQEIGPQAFAYCSALTDIKLPGSINTIEAYAFSDCFSLESINIPLYLNDIKEYTFDGCRSLKTVNTEEAAFLKSIGENAFNGCSSLYDLTLPKTVTRIGDQALGNCSSLDRFDIPESVESIGKSAFLNCTALSSIVIPSKISVVDDNTFSGCTSLTTVTLPESVTTIGQEAFSNCKLTAIEFPKSLTKIGSKAFSFCDWLETVTCTSYIPPVMESFNAFSNAAYDNATLIVPDEAYYDYLQSYGWDMFENTQSAAIEDVFAETTTVADIFNLQGIIIKRNASKEDLHSLPAGIYIVNGKKIVVK